MARHLKTAMIEGLARTIATFEPSPSGSARRARGVRYFRLCPGIETYTGIVNSHKEGRRYKKHIVSRRTRSDRALFQLYTYHFPKQWSAACVANRELIKEAQRRAHALEHAHDEEAMEWKIRFLSHYFRVVKGGEKPEEGLKPYAYFYQYTYVSIYRQLQAAAAEAKRQPEISEEYLRHLAEEVSVEPVVNRRSTLKFRYNANEKLVNHPFRPRWSGGNSACRSGTPGIRDFPACGQRAFETITQLPRGDVSEPGTDTAVHGSEGR